jgi:multiple sugar transport system permease protein
VAKTIEGDRSMAVASGGAPIAERAQPSRRKALTGFAFFAPFLVVFLAAIVAPLGYALVLSLFRRRLIGGTTFVGLDNYLRAAVDPQLLAGLARVGLFLVIQVPVMLLLALFVALAIDSKRVWWPKLFRLGVFVPYAVPSVVGALMWGFLYGGQFGLTGQVADALGVDPPDFFGPTLMLGSLANIVTWQFVGYNMLILYSALRVVDPALYEAAEMDGAGQLRIIRAIKLPALRGALSIATIFSIIGSFQLFNEPSVLKSLAPNAITSYFTPNLYAYSLSFAGQKFNYSATVAIVMGVITMIIAYAVQLRGLRKES